jgi:hypothetical protein
MARRSRKPPGNPAVRWLALAAFTTLLVAGGSAVFGWESALAWTVRPLLLACMVMVIVYSAFAIHLGWIATVGPVGQVYHVERSREPILFWFLALMYLGLAGPTAWYMAVLLLRSASA